MYRTMINELEQWKEQGKSILLLKGALGVGKTWTVLDYAQAFFEETVHVDFREDEVLRNMFLQNMDASFIDEQLKLLFSVDVCEPAKDILLVFDEVQVEENLFAAVMFYAREKRNVKSIIIASWMGDLPAEQLVQDEIDVAYMYPMTFEEFLLAKKSQGLCRIIQRERLEGINEDVMPVLVNALEDFFLVGGMPEAVAMYLQDKDWNQVDAVLHKQLQLMRDDILQYAPKGIVKKVLSVFESVPEQLTKDNKKFMYGVVDPKARAREYVAAVEWLVDSGFVRRIYKVNKGIAPLAEYVDYKSFELYHLDHGLLRRSGGKLSKEDVFNTDILQDMEGMVAEQYVLEELTCNENVNELFFWTSDATARIDFVFEDDGEVVPVDVQVHARNKAQNMKVFQTRYQNRMFIRISLEKLSFHKGRLNVPLYGVWNF